MPDRRPPLWLYASIVLTALLSLASLSYRYRAEQKNRAVAIVAEADALEELAASQGMSFSEALSKLKESGLGGVSVSEDTVGSLISSGEAKLEAGRLVAANAEVAQRLAPWLKMRFSISPSGSGPHEFYVSRVPAPVLRATPIGLDPAVCKAANDAGLLIVARCGNPPGINAAGIRETLAWAQSLGADYFLPLGDTVLGRRENMKETSEVLKSLRMPYAAPEFAKLGGDQNMLEFAPENVVRLHAAQAAELDKMPLDEAIDRFARAARERNIRLLMLRPIAGSSEKAVDDFGVFVSGVRRETVKQGSVMGVPHPFEEPGAPGWLSYLVFVVATVPLLWAYTRFRPVVELFWVVPVALIAHKVAAGLLPAMTFPFVAYMVLDGRQGKRWPIEYLLMSLISLVGGLVVASLHNGLPFLVRADQFSGVKVAHFAPILFIGIYLFLRMTDARKALANPINWTQAILTLVALAVLGLMAARTGNDNPAAVSGIELKFRAILDTVLFVRPRTKEFLVGHPLLILGIAALIWQRMGRRSLAPGWIAVLLTAGAIGQTSIVNTMCHFHTPLTLSLARLGVGFVAGGIVGAVLVALVGRLLPERGEP